MLRTLGVRIDMDEEEDPKENSIRKPMLRNNPLQPESIGITRRHFLPRTRKDIYNDAYLSFDFAMRNGVFQRQGPLQNKTRDALKEWLKLLQVTLPPTWSLQNMVSDIVKNFEEVVQAEDNLLKIVSNYPPKKKTWSHSCTRGDRSSGYTCGLWELFHIMTIGLVEWNNLIPGDDDWSYYRTEDAAQTLRNYIEHFFGCEVCRLNFLNAFEACAFDRCNRLTRRAGEFDDWIELPLWLFETHNAVNVRLMKERAEREHRVPTKRDEIDVQWPPREDCPVCWHEDGRWNQDKVFLYLRVTYW